MCALTNVNSTGETGKSCDPNFTPVEGTAIAILAVKLEFFLRSSGEELRRSEPTPVQRNRRLLLPLSTTGWLLAKPSLCISIVKVVEKTKQFDPSSYAAHSKRYEGANLVRANDKPSSLTSTKGHTRLHSESSSRLACKHPIVHCCRSCGLREQPATTKRDR